MAPSGSFPERRQTRFSSDQLDQLREAIRDVVAEETAQIKGDVTSVREKLNENTALTKEVLGLYTTMKSGYQFALGLGGVIKWLAGVALAAGVLWAVFKGKP